MSDKIHPELLSMKQQGAMVVSVIILFTDEDARAAFEHKNFTEEYHMKEIAGTSGAFNLESLDDLRNDDSIERVEPNHIISLPTDPSMPC